MADGPVLLEGGAVEESQGAHGLIESGPGGVLLADQEELIGPDLLRSQKGGRFSEVLSELGHRPEVGVDRVGREVANLHVFDHSLS